MPSPHDRLRELGLELPPAPQPLASYVPVRMVPLGEGRALLFVSGQVALTDGNPEHAGLVPYEVTVEEAQAAARR